MWDNLKGPAVAAVSVLHFAAVGGFVAGDVGPL